MVKHKVMEVQPPEPIVTLQMGEKFKLPHYLNPDLWATQAEWDSFSPFIDIPKTCTKLAQLVVNAFARVLIPADHAPNVHVVWNLETGKLLLRGVPMDIVNLEKVRDQAEIEAVAQWKKRGAVVTARDYVFWHAKSRDELLTFLSTSADLDGILAEEETELQQALEKQGIYVAFDHVRTPDMTFREPSLTKVGKKWLVENMPLLQRILTQYPIQWVDPRNPEWSTNPVRTMNPIYAPHDEYCDACRKIMPHISIAELYVTVETKTVHMRLRKCPCGSVTVIPNYCIS